MLMLRKEAEQDIASAYEWYSQHNPELGQAFLLEIEKALTRIQTSTEQFPKVYRDTHRALCRKFPYSIYFSTSYEVINIIAVLHQRRHKVSRLIQN